METQLVREVVIKPKRNTKIVITHYLESEGKITNIAQFFCCSKEKYEELVKPINDTVLLRSIGDKYYYKKNVTFKHDTLVKVIASLLLITDGSHEEGFKALNTAKGINFELSFNK